MAQAGSVLINLEAGTADFAKKIESGAHSLDDFGKSAHDAASSSHAFGEALQHMAERLALLEIARKSIESVKQSFEDLTEMGRNALRLGVAVDDFSRLQHAANATHTDIGALSAGMDHLNRSIGDVVNGDEGAKAAAEAFKKLGLDAKELKTLAPDETFRRVSAALGQLHSTYDRAAAVQELFGRGGRELIPMMEQLDGLMRESDDIGFTRTAENIKTAEEEERKLAAITDQIKGSLMDMATSGWAQKLIDQLDAVTKGAEQLWDNLNGGAGALERYNRLAHQSSALEDQIVGMQKGGLTGTLDEQYEKQKQLVELMQKQLDINTKAYSTGLSPDQAGDLKGNLENLKRLRETEAVYKSLAEQYKKLHEHDQTPQQQTASEKILDALKKQLATFGMKEQGKELFDLKNLNATKEQLAQAKSYVDRITAQEKWAALVKGAGKLGDELAKAYDRAMKKEGDWIKQNNDRLDQMKKRLLDSIEGPAQKLKDAMAEIKELYDAGKLTSQQAAQLSKDASSKFLEHEQKDTDQHADLVARQFTFDLPNQNATKTQDPVKKAADLLARIDQRQQHQDTRFNDIWRYVMQMATGTANNNTATVSLGD